MGHVPLLPAGPGARCASALFEHITDAPFVTDAQGSVVIDANPAAYTFFTADGSLIVPRYREPAAPAVTETFSAGAQTPVIACPASRARSTCKGRPEQRQNRLIRPTHFAARLDRAHADGRVGSSKRTTLSHVG